MKYNPDIHHRQSVRLREYDYSADGAYFVTLCTQDRECLFGDIRDGVMTLSDAGRMVASVWGELATQYPGVEVDGHVVMPNHFHGIVMLTDRRGESCIRPPFDPCARPEMMNQGDHKDRPYGTEAGTLGRVVQAFKSITTNAYIRGVKDHDWPPFPGRLWQRNYYERVIRDEQEMCTIREYITCNPAKWAEDKENPVMIP